ncbi:hypothetical protein ACGFRG_09060 [Streptomyces sp. NPDC048696]|uniref:hypothetical protein n=1 Tax=Streptomyces sp. NPDC048696 TaxID=3365585 RepID=UPI00371B0D66
MSMLPSADVFRSIELQVTQLLRGQLVCPHTAEERCTASEHLTLSEAKEAAARDAEDIALRDALWCSVGRHARSDVPNLAQRGQLLALFFVAPYLRKSAAKVSRTLYVDVTDVRSAMVLGALRGLALADDGDDVRDEIVRAAHDAGWAVERGDPAERAMDPHILVGCGGRYDDEYSPVRDESDIEVVGEIDSALRERISGERVGATLQHLGILDEVLASASDDAVEAACGEVDGPREGIE